MKRENYEKILHAEGLNARVLEDRDGGLHVVSTCEVQQCVLTPKDMAEAMRLAARDCEALAYTRGEHVARVPEDVDERRRRLQRAKLRIVKR